ncbi:DUF4262 domain-containing protein [Hypericibacter sp.]|uniref:DUF4262 domain-containing protein n=1 Tax=Hypericibacter sp. TaxID=2705401 RepID=UPI003D6D112A
MSKAPADIMRDKIRQHIDLHGQHLMNIMLTADDPPDARAFIYTIGNHERGLPELLLIGPLQSYSAHIVNLLGEIQRQRGRPFDHNELVDYGARLPARLVNAGRLGREEYAIQVGVFYGSEEFQVRQIIFSDAAGHFPEHPGCDAEHKSQIVLSPLD